MKIKEKNENLDTKNLNENFSNTNNSNENTSADSNNNSNNDFTPVKDLTEKKFVEATRRMNVDGVMSGAANNTENFMEYLKKYLKIIKTCDNTELKNCYAPSMILTGKKEQNIDITSLKTAGNLGQKEWNTNTMGFVIADGTTVIMAYNPACPQVDIFSSEAQNGQLDCLALLIDVNGKKGPNKIGKDIVLENAMISDCDISLERDYINSLSIEPRSTMTPENIGKYNRAMLRLVPDFEKNLTVSKLINTTNSDRMDASISVANEVVDNVMRLYRGK